jgi:MFS transporter, MHS family, proline/betaine transporter
MSATALKTDSSPYSHKARTIIAALIGNTLEWFDFSVYATFTIPIAHAFFASKNDFASLMGALLTFGLGFLARPLGSIFFGAYADRVGRKSALTITVLLMALSTLIIAICPPVTWIGIWAPIILVTARLLQGISAGGEVGSTLAFLVEHAPASQRAFYSAFHPVAQGTSLFLCGLFAMIITSLFSKSQVDEWAWRIPFLFGVLIAPVGFYIRKNVMEPKHFLIQREIASHTKLSSIFSKYGDSVLVAVGVVIVWTVTAYVTLYMPTYASVVLRLPQSNAYISLVLVGAIAMLCPFAGMLADRVGRKSVMLFASICLVVYPYPAFHYLVSHPSSRALIAVQFGLGIFMAIYTGPAGAFLAELFPTTIRATSSGVAFGLSVALFGGFTPTIVSVLANYTGSKLAVAFWLMTSAALSLASLWAIPDRGLQPLR